MQRIYLQPKRTFRATNGVAEFTLTNFGMHIGSLPIKSGEYVLGSHVAQRQQGGDVSKQPECQGSDAGRYAAARGLIDG